MQQSIIYALSDSIGETAELVARATASQFDLSRFDIIRVPYINSVRQIEEVLKTAASTRSVVCHTLVSTKLRAAMAELAKEYDVATIDIMGPMIQAVQQATDLTPKLQPGLMHKLDQEYFRRVEAVEFAVKYDDGKNPWGIPKADVVLIGVSRTSKTPLAMYLAHKRLKVANVPLVPEVPPPQELFQMPSYRVVGLIINPYKLNEIRAERLRTMGLGPDASYANIDRINEDLEHAKRIMHRLNCPVIDVSYKAIVETANKVLEILQKGSQKAEQHPCQEGK